MHSLLQMCLAAFNLKKALDTTRKKKRIKKSQAWEIKRKKFKICKTQVANKILSATLINMLFTKFILSMLTRRWQSHSSFHSDLFKTVARVLSWKIVTKPSAFYSPEQYFWITLTQEFNQKPRCLKRIQQTQCSCVLKTVTFPLSSHQLHSSLPIKSRCVFSLYHTPPCLLCCYCWL